MTKNVRNKIAKGELKMAIDELKSILSENNTLKKHENTLISLSARYQTWKKNEMLGVGNDENALNKIRSNILNLCDLLDNKEPKIITNPKKNKNYLNIIVSIGLLILLFSIYHFFLNKEDTDKFVINEIDTNLSQVVAYDIGLSLFKDFEKAYIGKTKKSEPSLMDRASSYKTQLMNFNNNELNYTSKIYKGFGLSICHQILGLYSRNTEQKIINSNKSIEYSEAALGLINQIDSNIAGDEVKIQIKQWLEDENFDEYFNMFILIALTNKYKTKDNTVSKEKLKLQKDKVANNNFLEKEGFMTYPILSYLERIL